MKMNLLSVMLVAVLAVGCSSEQPTEPVNPPKEDTTKVEYSLVNPKATAETRRVFAILVENYGKKTLSGTMARVDWNTDEAEYVYQWTGQYPALNCFDFINIAASRDINPKGWLDYSDISPVENWWKAGGLVSCMWHWKVRANNGTNMTCTPGTGARETSFNADCLDDTQSADYKQLVKDIDQVAGYLKQLQQAGIPVIWRPLHEGAGNSTQYEGGGAWFWWGAKGSLAYVRLWRWMYDRLVKHHGLNNLIWVWNSQLGDEAWYPGDDVVDIVGRDNYYALSYPLAKEYKQLAATWPNKIITLAECGNGDEVDMSPYSKIWQQGSRWSWFMPWYDHSYQKGSDEHMYAGKQWWLDAQQSGVVLFREDLKK